MDELTIDLLLSHSCSNPEDGVKWMEWNATPFDDEGNRPRYDGWNVYDIELHCIRFKVIAKPLGDGKYDIREYTTEDC